MVLPSASIGAEVAAVADGEDEEDEEEEIVEEEIGAASDEDGAFEGEGDEDGSAVSTDGLCLLLSEH